jgi:hypothetical protein
LYYLHSRNLCHCPLSQFLHHFFPTCVSEKTHFIKNKKIDIKESSGQREEKGEKEETRKTKGTWKRQVRAQEER